MDIDIGHSSQELTEYSFKSFLTKIKKYFSDKYETPLSEIEVGFVHFENQKVKVMCWINQKSIIDTLEWRI